MRSSRVCPCLQFQFGWQAFGHFLSNRCPLLVKCFTCSLVVSLSPLILRLRTLIWRWRQSGRKGIPSLSFSLSHQDGCWVDTRMQEDEKMCVNYCGYPCLYWQADRRKFFLSFLFILSVLAQLHVVSEKVLFFTNANANNSLPLLSERRTKPSTFWPSLNDTFFFPPPPSSLWLDP